MLLDFLEQSFANIEFALLALTKEPNTTSANDVLSNGMWFDVNGHDFSLL